MSDDSAANRAERATVFSGQPPRNASLMHRLVMFSLEQQFVILLMTITLIGEGLWALQRLPLDAYPDLSPPRLEIITQWAGHAAEEVERLITVPIERGMDGIPRLDVKRSISAVRAIGRHAHLSGRHRQLFCPPADTRADWRCQSARWG